MRQSLADLLPNIGDATQQMAKWQVLDAARVASFGARVIGAAAQFGGNDQQGEHGIGQAHHIGIVHQP